MALITCPDCGKEISDAAAACINCGRPMSTTPVIEVQPVPEKVQTIQLTGKKWESITLLGGLLACIGVIAAIGSMGDDSHYGFFMILGGLILFIIGRFGTWWHHK